MLERRQLGEVEVAYRRAGVASGVPAVLIHGYTGSITTWAPTVAALMSDGFRTISADNPGHGESSAPADPANYTIESMAAMHHELARVEGFLPAVILGHSMGGAIAQEFALRHPQDVLALVLIDTAGSGRSLPASFVAEMADNFRLAKEQGMAALWEREITSGSRQAIAALPPDVQAFLRNEFETTAPEGYYYCWQALREVPDTLKRLATFHRPTLIVRGEHEMSWLVRASDVLAATIQGARYEVVQGAGHSPQFERPDAFNKVLLEFLRSAGLKD